SRSIAAFVLLILACQAWVIASPLSNTASRLTNQSFTLLSLKYESVGSVTRESENLVVVDLPAEASHLAPVYAVKSAAVEAINVRNVGSKAISGHTRT